MEITRQEWARPEIAREELERLHAAGAARSLGRGAWVVLMSGSGDAGEWSTWVRVRVVESR